MTLSVYLVLVDESSPNIKRQCANSSERVNESCIPCSVRRRGSSICVYVALLWHILFQFFLCRTFSVLRAVALTKENQRKKDTMTSVDGDNDN